MDMPRQPVYMGQGGLQICLSGQVATDAVDIGSPERPTSLSIFLMCAPLTPRLGRLSPIHKFMLARQRGAFAARRLSDERESECLG